MRSHYDDTTDQLDDDELLAKESQHRDDLDRLQREQPELRDTTYGIRRFSAELVRAWERWRNASEALHSRGLVPPARSF